MTVNLDDANSFLADDGSVLTASNLPPADKLNARNYSQDHHCRQEPLFAPTQAIRPPPGKPRWKGSWANGDDWTMASRLKLDDVGAISENLEDFFHCLSVRGKPVAAAITCEPGCR